MSDNSINSITQVSSVGEAIKATFDKYPLDDGLYYMVSYQRHMGHFFACIWEIEDPTSGPLAGAGDPDFERAVRLAHETWKEPAENLEGGYVRVKRLENSRFYERTGGIVVEVFNHSWIGKLPEPLINLWVNILWFREVLKGEA